MSRPKIRCFRSGSGLLFGTDRMHLHESISAAADAARREGPGWIGPRSGIRDSPGGDAAFPIQTWASESWWLR